jgi:ABC-type iron transport system FetAB permease component
MSISGLLGSVATDLMGMPEMTSGRITLKARAAAQRQLMARANVRAADLVPVIDELKALGITSMRGIATGLDERGISTARGYGPWSPAQVSRLMKRIRSTVG